MVEQSLLESLPKDDVLFANVFSHLSVADLFHLRAVSRSLFSVTEEYFAQCQHICITEEDGMANAIVFKTVTKNNSSIKTLSIYKMGKWLDNGLLVPIANNCFNLRVIDLTGCELLTNDSLCTLGMNCNKLTHIWLGGCAWVNCDSFMMLISNNRSLKLLNIKKCATLDDDCVEFVAKCCPDLEHLDVSEISNLTDRSLDAIAKSCKNLKALNIIACWRITDVGIGVVKEYCRGLETLECRHCRDISEETLGALRFRGVSVDIQGRLEVTLRRLNHVIDYLAPLVRQINHNV